MIEGEPIDYGLRFIWIVLGVIILLGIGAVVA